MNDLLVLSWVLSGTLSYLIVANAGGRYLLIINNGERYQEDFVRICFETKVNRQGNNRVFQGW